MWMNVYIYLKQKKTALSYMFFCIVGQGCIRYKQVVGKHKKYEKKTYNVRVNIVNFEIEKSFFGFCISSVLDESIMVYGNEN